jgi:F-type H+-transporting ATPase subunit delta
MADITSIARPYAKAAFEYALDHQQISAWSVWLQQLAQLVCDVDCIAFIADPTTTPEQACALLLAVLKHIHKDETLSEGLENFVGLLSRNKRLLVLPSISNLYQECRAFYEKTLTVDVFSFTSLSKEQMTHLTERLSQRLQRQVTLSVNVDPALLGGAIIRAGNIVFDGSVRTQLKKLSTLLAA